MTKKSMLYLGAGILLIAYAVIACIGDPIWRAFGFREYGFQIFKRYGFQIFKIYIQESWGVALVNLMLILIGLVCIANAFVGNGTYDIVLIIFFALLTLSECITFLMNFINMIKYHQLNTWKAWLSVFLQLFPIMAFGGMAGIMLLKDAFGGLYFAPAAIQVVELVLVLFFANFIPIIGVTAMNLILNALLIGGLFILGKAFTDN